MSPWLDSVPMVEQLSILHNKGDLNINRGQSVTLRFSGPPNLTDICKVLQDTPGAAGLRKRPFSQYSA